MCTDGGYRAVVCDSNEAVASPHRKQLEKQTRDLFLTFHCYCTRKDVGFGIAHYFLSMPWENAILFYFYSWYQLLFFFSNPFRFIIDMHKILYQINCLDVLLEDTDIGKAITEYVSYAAIENLVLGASHHGFMR